MTPFKKAGYTEGTEFRVLTASGELKAGDIVKVVKDDGSIAPFFETKCGRCCCMYLPDVLHGLEYLEVYENI